MQGSKFKLAIIVLVCLGIVGQQKIIKCSGVKQISNFNIGKEDIMIEKVHVRTEESKMQTMNE
jgi:hypothetical protein